MYEFDYAKNAPSTISWEDYLPGLRKTWAYRHSSVQNIVSLRMNILFL